MATDRHGNVYEADYNGYVNQYFQGVNSVIAHCSVTSSYVSGVTVDSNNDVFVVYNAGPSGQGQIAEYAGGLQGCNKTVLGVSLLDQGTMAIDKNDDLVVVEAGKGTVDVIPPPYSSVARTIWHSSATSGTARFSSTTIRPARS
ncbi:MAG: hypothetical protein JO351_12680 [Candidatus Eremiobacteraeota bacterium]|nr:hypothetical protein [Candidatus Eremiobacteraeota bacterium]